MDIYTRDLVRSGHGTIGTPVIADADGKGVLICKLRRGQELQIKCVAKKVKTKSTPTANQLKDFVDYGRVSQKNTQNGPP